MTMIYSFTAPYPPSTNRIWRYVGNRVYLTTEAAKYKEKVGWLAKENGIKVLKGNIAVTLDIYRPRKSGDLANREKILCDALNGIAWDDDSQIVELHMKRFDDKENPRVEVEIEEVT